MGLKSLKSLTWMSCSWQWRINSTWPAASTCPGRWQAGSHPAEPAHLRRALLTQPLASPPTDTASWSKMSQMVWWFSNEAKQGQNEPSKFSLMAKAKLNYKLRPPEVRGLCTQPAATSALHTKPQCGHALELLKPVPGVPLKIAFHSGQWSNLWVWSHVWGLQTITDMDKMQHLLPSFQCPVGYWHSLNAS